MRSNKSNNITENQEKAMPSGHGNAVSLLYNRRKQKSKITEDTIASQLPEANHQLTDHLLIEKQNDSYLATVWGFPDCQAMGKTRKAAIENVQTRLINRLANLEIVSLNIPSVNTEHPWMQFAGIYADNPLIDEVQEFIARDRLQIDAELSE